MPNHHISQKVRIGQVNSGGQFTILETSDEIIKPQTWNQFIAEDKGFACDWTDPVNKGQKYKL